MAEYASKLASLGEMAGGIAHEINTPLAIISLLIEKHTENLEQGKVDQNALKSDLKLMYLTSTRIAKIIRSLRIFARTADEDPLTDTSLQTIIENTLALCYEKFKLKNLPVKVNTYSEQLRVHCREVQIAQVLLNLLNNAYDAVIDDKEKWIEISIMDLNNMIEIRVTDSGKGSGLGLSISKGLMETNHGNLYLDLESPNTSFVMTLQKSISV